MKLSWYAKSHNKLLYHNRGHGLSFLIRHGIGFRPLGDLAGTPSVIEPPQEPHNTVVAIPEDLPLTEAEKSVLSIGLNFALIQKKSDEFTAKLDTEKFLRRVQVKAFFHDEQNTSGQPDKDEFESLNPRKSNWTPEDQFASVDLFVKKCRQDIRKLNFNQNIKCSNLTGEEGAALKRLRNRKYIVIKQADKGGAVAVWRTDLYKQEAARKLADTKFYTKVNKDLTLTNQKIIKSSTIWFLSNNFLEPPVI